MTPADPLAALAAQHGAGAAAPAVDPLAALAAQHGAPAADFRQSDTSPNEVDPNTVGTFARHVGAQINPVPIGQALPFPQALGGAGWDAPIQAIKALGAAQGVPLTKAIESYKKKDYGTALRHLVDYLIPIGGPVLDKAADDFQAGRYAAGAGDAVGLAAAFFGPKLLGDALQQAKARVVGRVNVPAVLSESANPADQAAMAFADKKGIPVDLATRTGTPVVRAIQEGVADSSPIGGFVARDARATQTTALRRTADELASTVHPQPVTPEQAGGGLRTHLGDLRDQMHGAANDAYDQVRALEQNATAEVPARELTQAEKDARTIKMSQTLGKVPTESELFELRRIREEMSSLPYVDRTWNDVRGDFGKRGNAAGGDAEIVKGAAGASVYGDIVGRMPYEAKLGPDGKPIAKGETYRPTRGAVLASIDKALESGHFDKPAQGALEVARGRLAKEPGLSRPELPPSAGERLMKPMQQMAAPVDLRSTKTAIKPVVEQLERQLPITQQAANPGLHAMRQILAGPDYAPLSQVDRDLSTIKSVARKQGGVAKLAAGKLDEAVRAAAEAAGPELQAALERGRAATSGKYAIEGLRKALGGTEPVAAFRKVTAAGDRNIELLRHLTDISTPDVTRQIGRAWLDDLFGKATEKGGFGRGAKLFADWQKLGPETKKLLFPDAGHVQAIDNFVHLASRLSEQANPSRSAVVGNSAAEAVAAVIHPTLGVPMILATGGLAKVMHSPAAIKALTRGLSIEMKLPTLAASKAVRASVWANATKAADIAGTKWVPATASDEK